MSHLNWTGREERSMRIRVVVLDARELNGFRQQVRAVKSAGRDLRAVIGRSAPLLRVELGQFNIAKTSDCTTSRSHNQLHVLARADRYPPVQEWIRQYRSLRCVP